jgi:hypothetical protein
LFYTHGFQLTKCRPLHAILSTLKWKFFIFFFLPVVFDLKRKETRQTIAGNRVRHLWCHM